MNRRLWLALVVVLRPLALSGQCPDGSPPPCARAISPRPPAIDPRPSLTVLYLEVSGGDPTDADLAGGITEDVITRLSQVSGLRVTSQYAAERYRGGHALDPRRVGRELGVRYVLQGTLRRSVDRVRIHVALTDVVSGFNTWAQSYDQSLHDVFALQDSVATQLAEAVRGRLTGVERARLVTISRTTSEAYRAYLAARAAIRARTAAAASRAIADYQTAIALDSTYAPAYAGLAHAYSLAADWGWDIPGVPYDSLGPDALRAATRAIALDSMSAETWLGAAMEERMENQRTSLTYNQRAVRLDSMNVEAMHQLAWAYFGIDNLDSAIAIEQRTTTQDPFYTYAYTGVAEFLNVAGRPLEALAWAAQGISVDSAFPALYRAAAEANARLGRWTAARIAAQRARTLGDIAGPNLAVLTIAAFAVGDSVSARATLDSLEAASRAKLARAPGGLSQFDAGYLAGAYAQLADADSAIAWLRRVAPWQRRFNAARLRHQWLYDPLRSDPRFQAVLQDLQ